MRRWIARLGRLYPRAWRSRYGEEFDALLEDVEPDWKELLDVMGGAVKMRIRDGAAWKWVAAFAAAGMLVAVGASYTVNPRYVSSAVLRVTPRVFGHDAADGTAGLADGIFSRSSLAQLIVSLDLYKSERMRAPLEEIIQTMRTRDLHVERLPVAGGTGALAVRIVFAYPDREKAQAVVRALTGEFVNANLATASNRAAVWQSIWHVLPPAGDGAVIELLDPAHLSRNTQGPDRLAFVAVGLGAGLLVGVLMVLLRRRRGAVLRVAGWAAAGCVLAGGLSFAIPDRYTSIAVMRIEPAVNPQRWNELAPPGVLLTGEGVERMKQEVLAEMHNPDIDVHFTQGPLGHGTRPTTFAITYSSHDKRKAQAVVCEFISRLFDRYITAARKAPETGASAEFETMAEHKAGENLEVLDPASLPEAPVSPNRAALAGVGALVGLTLGFVLLRRRRGAEVAPA